MDFSCPQYINNGYLFQLHDRRVAVELDEFCKGTSLRSGGDMAEVWKLKGGVLNYLNIMHKIWPLDPAAMIIFRVLDEAHWASIAGDDKKLRANMVRQFFNEMAEENAGRAVVHGMCLTQPEARAKWLRLVEREFPHTSAMNSAARAGGGGGGSGPKAGGAAGKKFGKAGGQAGAGGGGAGSTGGSGGGNGGGGKQGSVFATPIPRFQGLSVCWSFNKAGCTRPAHGTNSCKDPNSPSIFAHVCNYWDPATKQHCYGQHSRSEPGRH